MLIIECDHTNIIRINSRINNGLHGNDWNSLTKQILSVNQKIPKLLKCPETLTDSQLQDKYSNH